jgi:hypothetical protein
MSRSSENSISMSRGELCRLCKLSTVSFHEPPILGDIGSDFAGSCARESQARIGKLRRMEGGAHRGIGSRRPPAGPAWGQVPGRWGGTLWNQQLQRSCLDGRTHACPPGPRCPHLPPQPSFSFLNCTRSLLEIFKVTFKSRGERKYLS